MILMISKASVNLKSVDLSGCMDITDVLISALRDGCDQLQMINFGECHRITDNGAG